MKSVYHIFPHAYRKKSQPNSRMEMIESTTAMQSPQSAAGIVYRVERRPRPPK